MAKKKTPLALLADWIVDYVKNNNEAPTHYMILQQINVLKAEQRKMVEDAWDLSTAATASDDTGFDYFTQNYEQ